MLREAESGARSRKSINVVRPPARRISMKPPPPMLPALGWVTASASPTAAAASMALPPFFKTSRPTTVAWRSRETTMPWRARTGWAAHTGTEAAISNRASVWRIHSILLCGPREEIIVRASRVSWGGLTGCQYGLRPASAAAERESGEQGQARTEQTRGAGFGHLGGQVEPDRVEHIDFRSAIVRDVQATGRGSAKSILNAQRRRVPIAVVGAVRRIVITGDVRGAAVDGGIRRSAVRRTEVAPGSGGGVPEQIDSSHARAAVLAAGRDGWRTR